MCFIKNNHILFKKNWEIRIFEYLMDDSIAIYVFVCKVLPLQQAVAIQLLQ